MGLSPGDTVFYSSALGSAMDRKMSDKRTEMGLDPRIQATISYISGGYAYLRIRSRTGHTKILLTNLEEY